MRLIKRYPNRKLYDTEAKEYIKLEGIADLIRDGADIQVIDNASGEDLTTATLSQIIFDQTKRQNSFLPRSVLAGLIQAGGDSLTAIQRNLFPQDFVARVDQEIHNRIHELVRRGELLESEGHRLIEQLLALGEIHAQKTPTEEQIEQVIDERNLPTRRELDQILLQLDELSDKLDEIGESR